MAESHLPLQVASIKSEPHWRVEIRPQRYKRDRVPYGDLEDVVKAAQVRLRGWYFPHISRDPAHRVNGSNYFGCWSDSDKELEFWQFSESAFLFSLRVVRETIPMFSQQRAERIERVRVRAGSSLHPYEGPINGTLDIIAFAYTIAECFEFAKRLVERLELNEPIMVNVGLRNIQGFVLSTEMARSLYDLYQAHEADISNSWTVDAGELRKSSLRFSVEATKWFFNRFGWRNASDTVIRGEIEGFLRKES
jgi:hypothetical protein